MRILDFGFRISDFGSRIGKSGPAIRNPQSAFRIPHSATGLAVGCGLVAGLLYLRTLAPGLLFGDPGEFQVAAWVGGLAHPTGYPLYLILGWLWSHLLPLGTPAWRMNVFSALWGAIAVGVTYLAAAALIAQAAPWLPNLARRLAAVVAAMTLATNPTFWSQAVIAEVYTLHGLLTALMLWLALRTVRSQPRSVSEAASNGTPLRSVPDYRPPCNYGVASSRPSYVLLAWIVGLGLAHHRTTLLWLPGLLAWAWLEHPTVHGPVSRRVVGAMLAGLLLPQLLYLYVPLRASATPYLSVTLGVGQALSLYDSTLAGFLAFVMGRAFAGEMLSPTWAWIQLPAVLALILRNLSLPGALLAGLGLVWLAWCRRWSALALTGLIFVAQLAFNLFYGIGDVYVLYVPIYLIAALWSGVGLAAIALTIPLAPFLSQFWERKGGLTCLPWAACPFDRLRASSVVKHRVQSAIPALGLLLPIALTLSSFPAVDRSRDHSAQTFWEGILSQPLPDAAVLVSNDRDEIVPLIYLQQVEGQRPDLTWLFPLMVARPGWLNVGQVTRSALETGRPVFLVKPMPGIEIAFDLKPEGSVVRVEGKVTAPAGDAWGTVGDALALQAVEINPAVPEPGRPLEITLYWRPLRPLEANCTSFVHLLDSAGEKIAQHDAPPGGVYYPTSLWQPGEILRDRHLLNLPSSLPAGPYALRVGLYTGPDLALLGEPLILLWDELTAHR